MVPARTVPQAKLTGYLLNSEHEVGGPKAVFFQGFGFSIDELHVMTAALTAHPDHNPVEVEIRNEWGITYVVRCSLKTPDGRDPCIRTVWIVPPGRSHARLVTAYPV